MKERLPGWAGVQRTVRRQAGLSLLCRLAVRGSRITQRNQQASRTSRCQQQPDKHKPASPSQLWRTEAQHLRVARGLSYMGAKD